MGFEIDQPLKSLVKPPITREQLREYALASGDNNPIHLDEKFAKEAGFPSVIAHGMLSMAFMADCVNFNFPPAAYAIKNLSCRFKKVTFPGDRITACGKVKSLNSDGSITLTLWTENQVGEHTLEGEALVISKV